MSDLFSDLDDEFSLSMKPNKSGNLSNLFGKSPSASPVVERKQPASQPQKEQPKSEPQNRPSVLYAIAGVICHKYNPSKNGYDLIGKIGAAVLGVPHLNTFQILLYRSNDDHVAQVPLSEDFQLSVQNELFASFADTRRQNWSIKFPSVESISLFCMHLAIAKSAIGGNKGITKQDILTGSGSPIGDEDQVKLTYSGYLVQDGKVGKMFDSNLASEKQLRFAVGVGGKVVSGLHEGVKGMMKRGKRVIVISPELAYGSTGIQDRVPPNSTVVYQVDVVAVKLKSAPEQEADIAESTAVISDVDEAESKRQEVIDRVKKFGVSMSGAVPVDLKPKESAPIQSKPIEEQPKEASVQQKAVASPEPKAAAPAVVAPAVQPQQVTPIAAGSTDQQIALLQSQFQQFMQMQMQMQQPQAAEAQKVPQNEAEPVVVKEEPLEELDDAVPFSNADNMKFIHDTKMIHEEIKASVVTASNKIETLQRDIKNTIFGRDDEVSKEKMSGSVLIQTITSYVEQNEQLQKEVITKGERIDELREKTSRILEKNKTLIEEHTNTMEERNNALTENTEQSRKLINSLRDEKLTIEEKLHTATEDLSNVRSNLSKLNHTNMDLTEHKSSMKSEILNLRTEANSLRSAKLNEDSESTEIRNNLRDEQAERKRLEEELEQLQEQLDNAKEILQKYRDGMEERKQKWIQIKAQMDKTHEDEKLVAMRQMKAQLLKLKKEKDEAVEESENIEHNVERRWRENIGRLKSQFKERVDELKADLAEEHQHDLQTSISDAHDLAKQQLKDTKRTIEAQYQAGFKAARHEQLSAESSAMITERENRLEAVFDQRKQFMNATIKKIMAGIFYSLREDLDEEETYQGSEVLVTLMDAVKQSTFDAMQTMNQHFEAPVVAREGEIAAEAVLLDDEIVDDVDDVVIDDIDDEGLIEDDILVDDLSDEIIDEPRELPGEIEDEDDVDDEFSGLLDATPKPSADPEFDDLLSSGDEIDDHDDSVPIESEEVEPEEVVEEAEDVIEELEDTIEVVEAKLAVATSEEEIEELEHAKEIVEELVEDLHEAIDEAEEDLRVSEIPIEEISFDDPEDVVVPESEETLLEKPEEVQPEEVEEVSEEPEQVKEIDTEEAVVPAVDLPDSTFSSDPFGVSKTKAKTFKSDDIFANKKSATPKKTDFASEDIFGSSTPKKLESTATDDDFFGGSPSTPKKKTATDTNDIFGASFSKKATTPKKSSNQPPDLFSMDITSKSTSSGNSMFEPKKKSGLDDIFGSGSASSGKKSSPAASKSSLDDIFSF